MSLHASSSKSPDGRRAWIVLIAGCIVASVAVVGVTGGHPGGTPSQSDAEDERVLVVEGPADETAHYQFAIDGAAEPADESDAAIESDDEINDTNDGVRVEGEVGDGDADAYRLSGDVTAVTLAGNATLTLDGEAIEPGNLSEGWAVTFANCSVVEVSGDFEQGYVFSTVIFPVWGPDGELSGYEENPIVERVNATNDSATMRAGTTLPEDVSAISALRSVFLYDEEVESVEPLLVESEVATQVGEPAVRVDNPAHETCRSQVKAQHENETDGESAVAP